MPCRSPASRPRRLPVAPRSALETTIADIWREVLQCGEVGAEDGFFDLGGHSLLATQVLSRLRRTFAVEVPLRRMFEPPSTVAKLAHTVVAELARHVPPSQAERALDELERLTDDEVALEIAACATSS